MADYPVNGATEPLQSTNSLDAYPKMDLTPTIGTEFERSVQVKSLLRDSNSDNLIRDLAILVAQRGVVFFRDQDLTIDEQKELGSRLGELSLKPKESKLHAHPLTEETSELGSEISIISSERRSEYAYGDRSKLASSDWHSDITFEPVPSDYSILKIHTLPTINGHVTGGDTLWASGHEVYDRLSPSFAAYLETLSAYHESHVFRDIAKGLGNKLRDGIRGHPENVGDALEAVHPVIRVNPVTGWKSVFVNPAFTKRIIGVTKDESDKILEYLFSLVIQNHDLQVRFKWQKNSLAVWDNRSNYHAATWDYENIKRVGDRVVSLGEKPYFSSKGVSRRQALGLAPGHGWIGNATPK